jgi:hypothetical protein
VNVVKNTRCIAAVTSRRGTDIEKLHNEELHNLQPSPNIIGMTKSREYKIDRTCNTNRGRWDIGAEDIRKIPIGRS